MVPPDRRPHHLDAGQMGISLVCRLGSGFPHNRAVARRYRFRQAAARSAACRSSTCTRPARSRRTNGISATSTRRCRPGRQYFCTGWSRRCAAKGDLDFLKRVFGRLAANFGWWVNRKDRFGRTLFEGGFLGLDNIGVFDRSAPLPTGGHLEQADGTAWVALFCQNMLEIAVELAAHDPTYEELATNLHHGIPAYRPRDERGRPGRHVGRGGRVLLRCLAPARRERARGSRSARWSGCCRSAPRPRSRSGSASGCRD